MVQFAGETRRRPEGRKEEPTFSESQSLVRLVQPTILASASASVGERREKGRAEKKRHKKGRGGRTTFMPRVIPWRACACARAQGREGGREGPAHKTLPALPLRSYDLFWPGLRSTRLFHGFYVTLLRVPGSSMIWSRWVK